MQTLEKRAQWPGWETVRKIGSGSHGAVYEIQRTVLEHTERAALKIISVPRDDGDIEELISDGYDSNSITQRYESYLKKIVEEYTIMADMKGHPNIVYCDDVKCVRHEDGYGWDVLIKMELLTSLRDRLNEGAGGEISEGMVRKLAQDISNALAFCASRNLIHRDVKPQNIFVSADGTFKLGDFGVAKSTDRTVVLGTAAGTYKYMAPEVFNNQPYGAKADVYSFGLTLYYLLNERRLPFLPLPPEPVTAELEEQAQMNRMCGVPVPPPKNGSEELKQIVLRACEANADARCSAAEMHAMLTSPRKSAPKPPQWPGWETVRRIGSGSHGTVYEIQQTMLGHTERAALKVIRIPRDDSDIDKLLSDGYDSKSVTRRYESDLKKIVDGYTIMTEIKGHPNIVSCDGVHYIRHEDGYGWDVLVKMELLTPLKEKLNDVLNEESVRKLARDISNALAFCASRNLIHRDVKPKNIFVSEDGTFKLGDFGVAKKTERTVMIGTTAGTFSYMAPEVYYNQPYGAKADVYSLGLTLYYLLNEQRLPLLPLPPAPVTAEQEEQAWTERMRGTPVPPPVNGSAELKRIVQRACSFSTDARCSIEEMQTMLGVVPDVKDDGQSGGAQRGNDVVPNDDDDGGDRKKRILVPLAGVAVLCAIAAFLFWTGALDGLIGARIFSGSGRTAGGTLVTTTATGSATAGNNSKTGKATGDNEGSASSELPATDGETTPAPTPPPVPTQIPISYSAWGETLPAGVRGDGFAIESREVYYTTDIKKVNVIPSASFVVTNQETVAGAWSAWQTTPITQTAARQVDKRTEPTVWSDWSGWIQAASMAQVPAKTATQDVDVVQGEGSWSEWSAQVMVRSEMEVPKQTDTMQVSVLIISPNYYYRTRTWIPGAISYRTRTMSGGGTSYRSRQISYTYTGYDNANWTAHEDFVPLSGTQMVKMEMEYRGARPDGALLDIPSMEHFTLSDRDYTGHYRDVDDTKWYGADKSNALKTANELAILYPDDRMNLRPEEAVTVGELIRAAVIVYRTYHGWTGLLCENDGDNALYAEYAEKAGLIAAGEFKDLGKEATRLEMARILSRALPEEELPQLREIAYIADMERGSDGYDSVFLLAKAGVLDAGQEKTFKPEETATRAQAASFIDKLVHPEERK